MHIFRMDQYVLGEGSAVPEFQGYFYAEAFFHVEDKDECKSKMDTFTHSGLELTIQEDQNKHARVSDGKQWLQVPSSAALRVTP